MIIRLSAPLHHLPAGTMLNGKYKIVQSLGEGGFGITYKGVDTLLDMPVAIKEYYPNGYANRHSPTSLSVTLTEDNNADYFNEWKEKYLAEARTLARLNDIKGIVNVRDFFEENGTAYIVMEYLNGKTLKQCVDKDGVFEAEKIAKLMIPLLNSLNKIHEQGLIHRDISPDNIMYMNDGTLKLYDFGAARDYSVQSQQTLSIMLKPGYAPQEQYRSKGNQGPWTDIYAICATMYFCITGIVPDDSLQRVFDDELKLPSELGITIPAHIEKALIKGMAIKAEERFQTTLELAQALAGEPKISGSIELNVVQNESKIFLQPVSSKTEVMPSANSVKSANKTAVMPSADSAQSANKTAVMPRVNLTKPHTAEKLPKKSVDEKSSSVNRKKILIAVIFASVAIIAAGAVILTANLSRSGGNSSAELSESSDFSSEITAGFLVKDGKTAALAGGTVERIGNNYTVRNAALSFDDIESILDNRINSLAFESCSFNSGASDAFNSRTSDDLKVLKFTDCTNTDFDAIDLTQYPVLEQLCLTNSGFGGSEFDKYDALSGIKYFELHQAEIADFSFLDKLNGAKTISLSCDSFNGDAKSFVSNKNLTSLRLGGYSKMAKMSESAVKSLAGASELYHLMLENIDVSAENEAALEEILPSLEKLEELYLPNCNLSSMNLVKNCRNLTTLSADGNNLKNLDALQRLIHLRKISFAECGLEDIGGLENCTQLQFVYLAKNNLLDISVLNRSADTLLAVDISDNWQLGGKLHCVENWRELRQLSVSNTGDYGKEMVLNSSKLWLLLAQNCGLKSIKVNSDELTFADVSHNLLQSASELSALSRAGVLIAFDNSFSKAEKICANTIFLSGNNITEMSVNTTGGSAGTIAFDYSSSVSEEQLKEIAKIFGTVIINDVPLDKQVSYENIFAHKIIFDENREQSSKKAELLIEERKADLMLKSSFLTSFPLVAEVGSPSDL